MQNPSIHAWNNFVMRSDPASYEKGTGKRAAALAKQFINLASNGGLGHALECIFDFDAREVLEALDLIGAPIAAGQLGAFIWRLKVPLPPMSLTERQGTLRKNWTEQINDFDMLLAEAYSELMAALTRHVYENELFYAGLAED